MSVPRNNLAELLKRKEQNALGSPQVYTPPPRTRSGPKFKPAISTPSGPSTSISSSGLPAFSTPGFRQAKPSPILTTTSEPIVISDYSNPETPHPLKRNSSDPDVVPDPSPQAFKRPKRAVIASDKENRPPPKVTPSSSKETTPTYVSQLASKAVASPSSSSSMNQSASRPAWMEAHVDLMEVSLEDLRNSKSRQHELLNTVMRLLLDGIGTTIPGDTKRFTSLRKDIEQRIEAIDWVVAQRKGKQRDMTTVSPNSQPISTPTISTPSITNPSVQLPPELSISSISSATFPARSTNAANLTRDRVIEVDDDIEIDTTPTRPQEPDSDAELWDSFELMPDVAIDTDVRAPPTKAAITAAPIDHSRRITTGTYMEEVYHQLEFVFGLKEFRPNQLEAISATLEGKDVFVLMPTGGGKSLCYQLPAVCTSGKTCGVTIVVSPLTALMEDQVSALTAKGVDAFFWSADSLQHEVSAKLFSGDKKPSLLYVTPEKLRASSSCRNLLERLYRQQQLARFAIDEAHCISTWGQDFRSAYQGLGQLRQDYPNVPIIALTATANERTRDDIVDQLRLRNPASFNQSFNRPNLKYYIEKKTKVLDSIVDFIQRKHPNSSGVIYCLSRRSCQNLAEQLQSKGLRAEYFHAGLDKDTKNRLLEEWKKDKFRIIVATIAFGMGIDKPDVRFVIHHDLPKSLSGYYQETGRAGRDGKPADCVLYYSYKDFLTICWMIENDTEREEPLTPEGIDRQKNAAREVVKYCNNISDCRRVQVLRHFGQNFDKRECKGGCDNCLDPRPLVEEDVTIVANNAIDIAEASSSITASQITQYLRGTNANKLRERPGLEDMIGFGTCKGFSKELVELAMDHLMADDLLNLRREKGPSGFFNEYVEVGRTALSFRKNKGRLLVKWRPPPPKAAKAPKQNQERPGKGKGRAAGPVVADPIESFPDDETPKATGSSSTQSSSTPPQPTPFPDTMVSLYKKLGKIRDKVRKLHHPDTTKEEEDMSETLIQSLSFSPPQDYAEFDRIIMEIEASQELSPMFKTYGKEFAQACVQHHLETSNSKVPVGMYDRFAHQPN